MTVADGGMAAFPVCQPIDSRHVDYEAWIKTSLFLPRGSQLEISVQIRYLRVQLSRQLGFYRNLKCMAAMTSKTVTALARFMPNVGGSKQGKDGY